MPPEAPAPFRLPSGKTLSRTGFGCSSYWSKPAFPEARALAVLEMALAAGVTYFDTGPSYAEGEDRLGRFLATRDRAALVVSTKVGTERDGQRSFAPERMRASFEGSLRTLGLGKVDMLYLHGPAVADLNDAVLGFLAEQKAAGRADLIGINSFDANVLERLVDLPVDVVMLQYNVADQRSAGVIERLHAAGKIVIAGTALAQGVYSPATFLPRSRRQLWYLLRALRKDPLFAARGMGLARRLAKVDPDPHAAAMRFVASHPRIACALFGSTNPDHVRANAAAAARPLAHAQRATLVRA